MHESSKKVSIIGAGSWGTALAVLLSRKGYRPVLWSVFDEEIELINNKREHVRKLPGVKIPESVSCTGDLAGCLERSSVVLLVVPSQTIRQTCRKLASYIKGDEFIVNCAKGIEIESGLRLSQVINQELPGLKISVLSGPSHAEEVARGIPTAIVAASDEKSVADFVQDIFMSPEFRVYTNADMTGVELGGALKNIIALCAGISDGLGYGDNTKAALMTRGIAEISRIGVALGAQQETFSGLAGIGDLIVTCTSMHSRNRRAGMLIGSGKSVNEALTEVQMVVEGVTTTKAAYRIAKDMNIDAPIIDNAYEVLFNGKNPRDAVISLMTRQKKEEMDKLL